ncbi:MAG: thioredoxin domain-containing protein [Acidiferrobacteraceae bacterium]
MMTRRERAPSCRVAATVLVCTLLIHSPGAWASGSGPTAGAQAPGASFIGPRGPEAITHFRGHKVMLWLLSTWCSSCQAGLEVLGRERVALRRAGLTILVVENYRDGGYGRESIQAFARRYGKRVLARPGWIFGTATRAFGAAYNPEHYPDIYYLIGRRGTIRGVDGAPSVTIGKILTFARGPG